LWFEPLEERRVLAVTADDSSESVHHGQELSAYVTAYDNESLPLEFSESSGPAHGVLSLNSDGSFFYSPNAGFTGYDSFEFAVTNGSDSDYGTVSIDVTNSQPTAFGGSESVLHDQALLAYLSESDADNDPLTYSVAAEPSHGTLALNPDGSYAYTPDPGYAGADSFDYFLTDGAATVTATLSIDVTNFAPVAEDDSFSTESGAGVSGNVLSNDHDADSDDLTSWLVSTPADGVLMYFMSDGTFEYVPNAGFSGTDSFTYQASDGIDTDTATVTIDVSNTAPLANDSSESVLHDQVLSSEVTATDDDGDTLTFAVVTNPANGVLEFNSDGTYTYTPATGYSGTDSFEFSASDGLASDTGMVTIDVINEAPVAIDDTYSAVDNVDLTIDVAHGLLANDTDPESDFLQVILESGPTNGIVSLNSDGSFSYNADDGFYGYDSFSYRAFDGNSESNVSFVTIAVSRLAIDFIFEPVTGLTSDVWVGERILLKAYLEGPGGGALTEPQWTVPGTVIADYTPSTVAGTVWISPKVLQHSNERKCLSAGTCS
jgi:hypothetical protein